MDAANPRYVVIPIFIPDDPDEDVETREPVACTTGLDVLAAVEKCQDDGLEWSIWEWTAGRFHQRSIVFTTATVV